MKTWYTIFSTGDGQQPAKGPYPSMEETREVLRKFVERYPDPLAAVESESSRVQILGPFNTRKLAREAHIYAQAEADAKAINA